MKRSEIVGIPVTAATRTRATRRCCRGAHARLILAPGAGTSRASRWMRALAGAVARQNIEVWTFDFLRVERRHNRQIRKATWQAVLRHVREVEPDLPIYIGGKSRGGHVATEVAAEFSQEDGGAVKGLVLLTYPFHAREKYGEYRKDHFGEIDKPILFVQGALDAWGRGCELVERRKHYADKPWVLRILPDANHWLAVDGSKELPPETCENVAGTVANFICVQHDPAVA